MSIVIKNNIEKIIKDSDYEDFLTNVSVSSKGLDKSQMQHFSCEIDCSKPFSINTSTSNFVWVTNHYTDGKKIYIDFKTGFASPLTSWQSEISHLLFFYVTPQY